MSDLRLAERYQSVLEDFLAGIQEPALQQAYELGRQALAEGLGILDVATVHGEALARALLQTRTPESSAQVAKRATEFFLESVSAFEMVDRGFREANTTLRQVNATLEQRTAELQAANRELARDADQYTTMLATTPDGFWRFDTDGKLLEVNDVYCQMSGYSRDELLRLHIHDLEAIEKPENTAAHIRRVMQSGFERFESQHRKKDGTVLDVEISVSFWRATGQFLLFARDISERKRAEEALRKAHDTLELRVKERTAELARANAYLLEEKTFSETAINSMPGIFYLFKEDGRFLRWNRNFERVTGYSSQEISEMSPLDFFDPAEKGIIADAIGRVFAEGQVTVEASLLGKSGLKVPYYFTGFRMVVDGVPYLIGAGIDMAERKQAEERVFKLNIELERHATELEAANKELEAFSYSISHDLRTPLATIDGFAGLLLQDYAMQLAPEALNYARLIHAGAQEMQKLVTSLLDFSRSGRQPLKRARVAPAALARAVLDELLSQETGRQVETVLGELPPCQADPILLKQVFANLLSNAFKFTRTRAVARIEIGVCPRREQTTYFVRDNGVGFDMEQADKLFGVFQRLHPAEDFEGNGVGLAIVARIVHRHGGRIWAEAKADQGATFYFTLGNA